MTKTNDILNFIENIGRDPAVRAHFASDLSFWWANIMNARFNEQTNDKTSIIYNSTSQTFGIIINGSAFNAHGSIKITDIDEYVEWQYYYTNHSNSALYVLRDRVYFISPNEWGNFLSYWR